MPPSIKKRIVICADGTWNDPEDEIPTNVMRMARAIAPVAKHNIKQVVFYDWGVGTYHKKAGGGVFGLGMDKNIQDCYRFIVQNHNPGDEIFLFGFSRGAYTIRCLAGMLNNCGILKRKNADKIDEGFKLYKSRSIKPGSPGAEAWRQELSQSPERGVVDFIGVWDTVGALGVPTRALAFAEESDLFFDRYLGSNVKVARHAVAIDERRADFEPTHWKKADGQDIREVWFAGVHSDIGGGYKPNAQGQVLSDIPLDWMSRQAEQHGLEFESHLVTKSKLAPLAPKHKSRKRFWKVLGKKEREIPIGATMHKSVKKRYLDASSDYRPDTLTKWLKENTGWGVLEN